MNNDEVRGLYEMRESNCRYYHLLRYPLMYMEIITIYISLINNTRLHRHLFGLSDPALTIE